MTEKKNSRDDDLGLLEELIEAIRLRLLPDGPEVDFAKLYAYVAGALTGETLREVEQNLKFASWHDAMWELKVQRQEAQKCLELETNPEDNKNTGAKVQYQLYVQFMSELERPGNTLVKTSSEFEPWLATLGPDLVSILAHHSQVGPSKAVDEEKESVTKVIDTYCTK